MTIQIKDKKGDTAIRLKNFVISSKSKPLLVDMDIEVDVNDFKAKINTTVLYSEIEGTVDQLEVLYKTLTRTFWFFDLDQRVAIKFAPTATGNIQISGNIKSLDYATSSEFMFGTDQSFIPELISQIKNVLKTLNSWFF
ncbi:MAG TPA: hypothetical protein VK806_11505 [Bacteroidia bacterium]|nr:hypothetical protein [Bacteroidia bacterium]